MQSSYEAKYDQHAAFLMNKECSLTSIWSLIPQVPMGGSKYQLVSLSPACGLILRPLHCLASTTYSHIWFIHLENFFICCLWKKNVLFSGYYSFSRFSISVFFFIYKIQQNGRWDYPAFVSCFWSPCPPPRKTNLHGQINSNGSQTTLLKYLPTEQIAWHIFHFHIHLEGNGCCTSDKLKGNHRSNAETFEVNSITSGFDVLLEMFWTPGLSFFIYSGARHWVEIHSTE